MFTSVQNVHLWITLYTASEWIVRLVMLLVVPFRRSPAAAKSWLLLMFFLPWPALVLYLFIGRARLPRVRAERFARLPSALKGVLGRLYGHPSLCRPELGTDLDRTIHLARSLGKMPILGGNSAEILTEYDGVYRRMVADIDAAQHHVHLLFYIFATDDATRPILEALGRAVQRGVACRILVDAVGSRAWLGSLRQKCTELGVRFEEVLPVGIGRLVTARPDLRNHRKIAVFDGRVGYTGSQNLVDSHFKPGITYEELVVRVTGPVVLELQATFVGDWYLESDELLEDDAYFPFPEDTGTLPAQLLPSGPDYLTANYQRFLVDLIYSARRRVVLTTPYFIPDEPLLQALQTAVARGVEVLLIVSRQEDQFLVCAAQKSYYEELLEAGVSIHLYHERFLHAKHLSVDDRIAIVGSSNMDIRSFMLNAEVSLVFYDEGLTSRLWAEQQRYLECSERLTAERWAGRSFRVRMMECLARLLSPLL